MFSQAKKWNNSVQKLNDHEITLQQFVDLNKKKALYYSTPIGIDEEGKRFLCTWKNDTSEYSYFPVFTAKDTCKCYYNSVTRGGYSIMKGDLSHALHFLDLHPVFSEWGIVIALNNQKCINIPPHIRVSKKSVQ